MSFYERLVRETAADREFLVSAPVIRRCLDGEVSRQQYLAFLQEAYHHVRHTVPLLMAVGSRLPEQLDWLRGELREQHRRRTTGETRRPAIQPEGTELHVHGAG